jgi:hypothetical protein
LWIVQVQTRYRSAQMRLKMFIAHNCPVVFLLCKLCFCKYSSWSHDHLVLIWPLKRWRHPICVCWWIRLGMEFITSYTERYKKLLAPVCASRMGAT